MTDPMSAYLDDLDNAKDKWVGEAVLPYTRAYSRAYGEFQDTFARQQARERLIAELVVLGLSMASGSIIAMAAGQTVMKSVAVDAVVNTVCNREMNRAFKLLAMAEGSAAARFALGSAWDGAVRVTRSQTTAQVARAIRAPSTTLLARPSDARAEFERFVINTKTFAHDEMVLVRDDPNMDADAKLSRITAARQAPIFKTPPTLDVDRMAREIELGFYLSIIINSDRLQTVHYRPSMKSEGMIRSVHGSRPIDQRTSSPNYPAPSRRTGTTGFGGFTTEEVDYRDMGHALKTRVNRLANEQVFDTYVFGRFSENLAFEHVKTAERLMAQTAKRNAARSVQGMI